MIGPSSGATSGMSNHDVGENSVRLKRRTFDELEIENYCDEVCHNTKKRNTMDCDPLEMALSDIVHTTTSSSSASQFPLVTSSLHETSANNNDDNSAATVARLEVLVVDGSWDVTSFGESDLIDLSASTADDASVENLISVGEHNMENNYSTILSYWESPPPTSVSSIENNPDQCTNIVENSEPSQLNPPVIPSSMSINQQDDHEHGNLSWLLDFKLDSLIEAPEEKNNISSCACHNQNGKLVLFCFVFVFYYLIHFFIFSFLFFFFI